ncbi:MAG TPA: hypothetical protein VFQ30_19080 [Ktedonobacteraceae bacterium]|nr:hypothetical protein [Ktedonobacteraceae bacterium]
MNCNYCGVPLPTSARACPNCGAATPIATGASYYTGEKTVSANENATLQAPPYAASEQVPSSGYGANPYGQNTFPAPSVPNATVPASSNSYDPYGPLTPPSTPVPSFPAYNAQQAGTQPYYPNPSTPAPFVPPMQPGQPGQPQKPARRFSTGIVVLIVILAIALIGGSGLVYYGAVYQPNREHAQATATAQTQATQTANVQNAQATAQAVNPYTHNGTLAFTDALSANNKAHNWDTNSNCAFNGGSYQVIAPNPQYSDYCIANNTNFSDFAYEVQMKVVKGDAGGLLFRVMSTSPNQYYEFYIGQDSSYALEVVNGDKTTTLLTENASPAIHTGLNQTNLIGVVAQGNKFTLYVNHQSLGSTTDSTFSHGQIGVDAAVYNQATTVSFSNARLWKL